MARARRSVSGIAVVAALAVGHVIGGLAGGEEVAPDPFVRTGDIGEIVHLEYADVAVTDVLVADALSSSDGGIRPAGRFLVVDTTLRATVAAETFLGSYLVDSKGRFYLPDPRAGCAMSPEPIVGATAYARFCFDVPRGALEGAALVLSRGAFDLSGDFQRRDDVASIDLGLDRSQADDRWQTATTLRSQDVGYEPLDTTPFEEPARGVS